MDHAADTRTKTCLDSTTHGWQSLDLPEHRTTPHRVRMKTITRRKNSTTTQQTNHKNNTQTDEELRQFREDPRTHSTRRLERDTSYPLTEGESSVSRFPPLHSKTLATHKAHLDPSERKQQTVLQTTTTASSTLWTTASNGQDSDQARKALNLCLLQRSGHRDVQQAVDQIVHVLKRTVKVWNWPFSIELSREHPWTFANATPGVSTGKSRVFNTITDRPLACNVSSGKRLILVLHSLNVETRSWNCGDLFIQFELPSRIDAISFATVDSSAATPFQFAGEVVGRAGVVWASRDSEVILQSSIYERVKLSPCASVIDTLLLDEVAIPSVSTPRWSEHTRLVRLERKLIWFSADWHGLLSWKPHQNLIDVCGRQLGWNTDCRRHPCKEDVVLVASVSSRTVISHESLTVSAVVVSTFLIPVVHQIALGPFLCIVSDESRQKRGTCRRSCKTERGNNWRLNSKVVEGRKSWCRGRVMLRYHVESHVIAVIVPCACWGGATLNLLSVLSTDVPWVSCRDSPVWRHIQDDATSKRQLVRWLRWNLMRNERGDDYTYTKENEKKTAKYAKWKNLFEDNEKTNAKWKHEAKMKRNEIE